MNRPQGLDRRGAIRSGRRRRLLAAAAVTSLAGAAVLTSVGSAQASPWATTRTRAVTLTGTRLGATPAGRALHLTLALTPRDAAGMQAAVRATYTPGSATYHHYLTAAQWRARYAPSASSAAAVVSYLHHEGMDHVEVSADRLGITADATAAQAERAFHTSLVDFRTQGRTVFANATAAAVPSALGSTVSAVLGLNDVPLDAEKLQHVTPARRSGTDAAGPASTAGLFPGQFRTTYDANGTTTGSKTAVAVMTEGKTGPVISSLRYAEKLEHERRVPVTVVRAGTQSADVSGADEFDMDTQASSMMATKVKRLYMYNIGGLTDAQIVYAVDRFVSDDLSPALSASIGGCEYNSFLDGSEFSLDTTMQEAALQGQSFMASSGDEGDACAMVANTGTPAGVPQDEWPAVGAYDLAVGGTSLVSDAKGDRIQELAWLGGGGGDSTWENPGFWEQDTDPGYDTEFASGGRAVPDVALDADPNVATPVKVIVGKKTNYVGGTSLASPLMLGVWARLESAHGNRLGLAPIALYDVYDKVNPGTPGSVEGVPATIPAADPLPVKGFTDITMGSNGAYQATPGWDYTTGLGAPDVKPLMKAIVTHMARPAIHVRGRVLRGKASHVRGARHRLRITVRLTGTHPRHPATGTALVQVIHGAACRAVLHGGSGSCTLTTTKAKNHALRVVYSGDVRYARRVVHLHLVTR